MDIGRFGKFLFFRFSTITLISHLRMEGKYFLKHSFELIAKHEHVIFHFTDGTSLRYHDTRKFGTMELVEPGNEFLMPNILLMGPEPFDNQFNLSYLKSRIKSSIRPIKSFLLDQNNVSGLGNIYVDEVLFLSRVHPETQVKNLSDSEILKIIDSTQAVINKAIELGGTTIRSYLSSLGITGRFQNELNVHLRALKPCIICNTPIIKIKVGGRGTYICPTCQKRKG
jgi:formamidopyrimidine-DNA glycosylase